MRRPIKDRATRTVQLYAFPGKDRTNKAKTERRNLIPRMTGANLNALPIPYGAVNFKSTLSADQNPKQPGSVMPRETRRTVAAGRLQSSPLFLRCRLPSASGFPSRSLTHDHYHAGKRAHPGRNWSHPNSERGGKRAGGGIFAESPEDSPLAAICPSGSTRLVAECFQAS